MKLDWGKRDIAVSDKTSESGITIISARVKGGLAYHRSLNRTGHWGLSHVNSGASLGFADTAQQARNCGDALLKIADWTFKTPTGFKNKDPDLGKKARPIVERFGLKRGGGLGISQMQKSSSAALAHNSREIAA